MPLTAQRFFDFCEKEAREVEAVFILGDLFEYWVGDDANVQSPFHSEVKNALAALSSRVKTYYMHGNRDFLVGSSFLKKTGMT
jgi:UDP-2,3-diacylglucosamine hydrolase